MVLAASNHFIVVVTVPNRVTILYSAVTHYFLSPVVHVRTRVYHRREDFLSMIYIHICTLLLHITLSVSSNGHGRQGGGGEKSTYLYVTVPGFLNAWRRICRMRYG